MDSSPRDPGRLRRQGIIQRLLGRMNLRFPGLFTLLAILFLLDLVIPDPIPFFDEIVLGILMAIFGLWKDRRQTTASTTVPGGPPLPPPAAPPLPSRPPDGKA